jgi:hypothetical protein
MLKTIICLSAFLMVGSVASYANENVDVVEVSEVLAYNQAEEDAASDVLTDITQILAGCPNCPRNPKG